MKWHRRFSLNFMGPHTPSQRVLRLLVKLQRRTEVAISDGQQTKTNANASGKPDTIVTTPHSTAVRVLSVMSLMSVSRFPGSLSVSRKRRLFWRHQNLVPSILGHVGDGNFHVVFPLEPDNTDELAEAQRLSQQIVDIALEMDGTCTGEHGVGIGKRNALEKEHGEAVDLMRAIKHALDSQNLMNPGKVFL